MSTKEGVPAKPQGRRKTQRLWHLVTNHQNLLYMLAAGMVTGPAGFPRQMGPEGVSSKYYADPLDDYPGWIPLFRHKAGVPAEALKKAHAERDYLIPCIASFDLDNVSGEIQMLPSTGGTRPTKTLPTRRGKHEIAALLRAPLPLYLLSSISFRSAGERETFKAQARDFHNIDLLTYCDLLQVSEPLFAGANDSIWPPKGVDVELAERDHAPVRGPALGGVIAMLYHIANHSDFGLDVYRLTTNDAADPGLGLSTDDPILAALPGWLDGERLSDDADIRARLFWGVADALVEEQKKDSPRPPVDTVLACLEAQRQTLDDDKYRTRLGRLIDEMRNSLGLGGGTITELLEEHKGPLSRSLLLFALRAHCVELLELSHPLLGDADQVLAAILFGIRDTWLDLPAELRNKDLADYVTYRMAVAEHRVRGRTLSVVPPPAPRPLRALFPRAGEPWSDSQQAAAVRLSTKFQWHNCLRTRLILTGENLPSTFEREGNELVIPGPPPEPKPEIIKDGFLRHLGALDRELEDEARKEILAGMQAGIE